mgnify:CR=1 FL=1|tara:strand:- start:815 stop:1018 length:204 start_codon:yes stop_codon:yes gene_type:complete
MEIQQHRLLKHPAAQANACARTTTAFGTKQTNSYPLRMPASVADTTTHHNHVDEFARRLDVTYFPET